MYAKACSSEIMSHTDVAFDFHHLFNEIDIKGVSLHLMIFKSSVVMAVFCSDFMISVCTIRAALETPATSLNI